MMGFEKILLKLKAVPFTERSAPSFLALLAAGVGLVALLGWIAGLPLLATFAAGRVPMAPSTALLFVLFGTAVFSHACMPQTPGAHRLNLTLGLLGTAVSLLLLVLSLLGIRPDGEHLGFQLVGTADGVTIGHISPLSASCFVLVGLAFLALLSSSSARRGRAVALSLAFLVVSASAVCLLAYLLESPVLYGSGIIPPALPTSLAFLMLGTAILVHSGQRTWPRDDLSDATGKQPAWAPVTVFVLLAAGIVTASFFYLRSYERQYRAKVEQELSAIAELKVGELVQWREERLSDAALFFKNPSFTAMVRRFFEKPQDADAHRQLLDWLGKYPASDDYDQVRLMDVQGVTRLSLPDGLNPASTDTVRAASEALRLGQVTLQDFYQHEHNQRIYLSVQIPILDESNANRPLGVLVLRIDPEKYLYPFVKRWPTLSPTAETVLVRQDGNDVLYLNDLRHQTNAELALRGPLTRTDVPAIRAALSKTGFMEGLDYRGVPVISIGQAVPNSPWMLIAKIDAKEVYGPLRERWEMTLALLVVLLVGGGVGLGLLWRQRRLHFYQEKAQAAETLRESEKRFMDVMYKSSDAILLIDGNTFVDCNEAAFKMLGYPEKRQCLMTHPADLSPPIQPDGRSSADKAEEMMALAIQQGVHQFEWMHCKANGEDFPVEVRLTAIVMRGKPQIHCTWRDLTEQKLVRAALEDQRTLLTSIIDGTNVGTWRWNVQTGKTEFNERWADIIGYTLAELAPISIQTWLGRAHPDDLKGSEAMLKKHFMGTVNYYDYECRMRCKNGSWVWVHDRGKVIQWTADGKPLVMTGTHSDITQRKQAETVRDQALSGLQAIARQVPGLVYQYRLSPDGSSCMPFASDAIRELFRISPEEVRADASKIFTVIHPDDYDGFVASIQQSARALTPWHHEYRVKFDDGTQHWHLGDARPQQEADGSTLWHGFVTNITERKQAETYGEMGQDILKILNEPGELQDSIQRVLAVLKADTGFDAVGLRLQDGEDFPYFAQQGFPKDFLLTENTLVERTVDGGVCRGKDGKVCLECTCGLVISGQTDPANPLFTPRGSCWTNDSFPLLDLPPSEAPRLHPRNHCIHHGYASVALVPIRNQDRIVGLIQLNDRRKGCFTLATVEIMEGIAAHIGAALIRKQVEEALQIEQTNLKAIFASAPVGMLLLDDETMIVDANSVLVGMVSRSLNQIIQQRGGGGLGCVHSLEDERGCGFAAACPACPLRKSITQVLTSGTSIHGVEIQTSLLIDGQEQHPWLSVSAEPVLLHGRKHVIVAVDDITPRKALEEELRTTARTDRLTGLPNRALFCDRLQQVVLRAKRHQDYHFGVLFLDFDRFKAINDSCGHDVGDLLLQEIGRRLQATVRSGDSLSRQDCAHTTARLGGDEFVVLLDGLATPQDATVVANRLLDALAQPYQLGRHKVYSTASIGIVTSEMPADSADDLLRDADTAMYEAKLAGKGRFVVFDIAMRERVVNRLNLEYDLRQALGSGQLFLMYQPIVSLQTGELESLEALVRWQHPQRGLISPGEFIPIAEDTGLILPIGEWVLREACRQFACWRANLGAAAPHSISVNLSRNQLLLPDLPQTIRGILEETGVPPECLHLEVTESAVMKNPTTAIKMLHAIKALGVKLDIDDFGTGHSSLACLHQFPIDVLKIDRSFVMNIDRGRDFAALVHAVAQLARNLNILVVAEGIETPEQALMLQSLECEFGQGYLFSKPLPADKVAEFRVSPGVLPGQAA